MRLDGEAAFLIASALPPEDAAPEDIARLAKRLEQPLLRRTFAAAARLQRLMGASAAERPPPAGTWLVTYGFIPLGDRLGPRMRDLRRHPTGGSFVFGVSVMTDADDDEPYQDLIGEILLDGQPFPVVLTRGTLRTQAAPPHPGAPTAIGASACWVRYNGQGSPGWSRGVLTARHVLASLNKGDPVTLDPSARYASPSQGWVGDYGACSVDAGVVGIDPADWPGGLSPLACHGPYAKPMAPAQILTLEGRSKPVNTTLLSHFPLPGYWGAMMGQRLVIDDHGAGGDSGGLVTLANGDAVGVYMGSIDDGAGGKDGLCQDMHQARVYLECDLFL